MLKTYVLNLDKHDRRMQKMRDQLSETDLDWARFPGIDAGEVDDAFLDSLVARRGPIPRMPRGARACTASHFQMLREFVNSNFRYALILEDDALISPKLATDLPAILAHSKFEGILNINRQTPSRTKKRLVTKKKSISVFERYSISELVGIHYGTAGYVIERRAALKVLDEYSTPDLPIDHILFNPNVSKISWKVKTCQLFPALVSPNSDMDSLIQAQPVRGSKSISSKLKRAKSELSIAPRLLIGLSIGLYKLKVLELARD